MDLEEMMLMEAIRQSLEEEEVRKRKEEEEERKKRGKMKEVQDEGKGKNVDRGEGEASTAEGSSTAAVFGFEASGNEQAKRSGEAEHVEIVHSLEGYKRS